jgi:MFS family permease
MAKETARGRAIGVYYLIRGMVVFPASLVGGWLWKLNHQLPFYVAFLVGIVAFLAYAVWGKGEKT